VDVERIGLKLVACTGALLLAASMVAATEPEATPVPSPPAHDGVGIAPRPEGEPIFFRWLDEKDPVDATILEYWKRYEAGELNPEEIVDLGTMLFERGWPKDALRLYQEAGKADPTLYDAWLRAGLVAHSLRDLGAAKKYYKKCLKIHVGNGWCNFYMGLAEEQTYNGSAALKYYAKAFKVNPDLSDPRTNPAVLQSRIARAAAVAKEKQSEFVKDMPMTFLDPEEVERARARYENRQRKIEMWEARAAGERSGTKSAPPHPETPAGSRSGHLSPPVPSGSSRGTAPAQPAGAAGVGTTPGHGSPVSRQHGAPAASPAHPAPTPPGQKAMPAPPPVGSRKTPPWGGGPLPRTVAPGHQPVVRTPLPTPTPVPEKK